MGFSRQEYWSGLPFPSPENLPNPEIECRSLALQTDSFTTEPPGKPPIYSCIFYICVCVCVCVCMPCSIMSDSATPGNVAHQAPLPMGFSRQESWSGLSFPPPGDLPTQGSNPHLLCLLHWQVDWQVSPGKPISIYLSIHIYVYIFKRFIAKKVKSLSRVDSLGPHRL